MTNNNCLNCEKELIDKYCSGCGQKADTHRITFKNFIFHDLLHGTFHIERGMLFTAKQSLLRPGKAALDYISGKRKPYYNVFLLILLTIATMLSVLHFDEFLTNQSAEIAKDKVYLNEASKKLDEIFSQKIKIILLLFVPLGALNSFTLFRRKRLNLSEHFIIAGMIFLGILLISTFANILFYVNMIIHFNDLFLSLLLIALIVFYIGYAYFNAFSIDYSHLGIALRIILFFVFICFEIVITIYFLIGVVTDWKFDTTVSIAPFG